MEIIGNRRKRELFRKFQIGQVYEVVALPKKMNAKIASLFLDNFVQELAGSVCPVILISEKGFRQIYADKILLQVVHTLYSNIAQKVESPRAFSFICSCLETVQDFLIKLDIKPIMHLLEISIFPLNNDLVRLNKIMNNLVKDLKILRFKVIFDRSLVEAVQGIALSSGISSLIRSIFRVFRHVFILTQVQTC